MHAAITVRRDDQRDLAALRYLAELDSAPELAEPILVAEAGGEPRAALSLADGAAIADPFHPTADMVELLRLHASQLAHAHRPRLRDAAQALSPRRLLRVS